MNPTRRIRVLLISGSTRTGSSNTLALRKMHELDHPGVATDLYTAVADLPAFVPGDWNVGGGQLRTVLGYVGARRRSRMRARAPR